MPNKSETYDLSTRVPWPQAVERVGSEEKLRTFAGPYTTRRDWEEYGVPGAKLDKLLRLLGDAKAPVAYPEWLDLSREAMEDLRAILASRDAEARKAVESNLRAWAIVVRDRGTSSEPATRGGRSRGFRR